MPPRPASALCPIPSSGSLGVPLVTGDIPGVAVVLGKARPMPLTSCPSVKDYQSKGILTFLIGGVIDQCAEGGVEDGPRAARRAARP